MGGTRSSGGAGAGATTPVRNLVADRAVVFRNGESLRKAIASGRSNELSRQLVWSLSPRRGRGTYREYSATDPDGVVHTVTLFRSITYQNLSDGSRLRNPGGTSEAVEVQVYSSLPNDRDTISQFNLLRTVAQGESQSSRERIRSAEARIVARLNQVGIPVTDLDFNPL